ncbi:uncharacterized protein [Dermacentor albipictus]|uniref:uncharacterized protein isoform X1 n=1 Tax=Dermacentor albipictus TaxID=60249 RepID=UPI0038FC9C8D
MIASDSAASRIQNELGDAPAGTLKLTMACHGGPGKFARALLHHVFTEEELRSSHQGAKEALDPTRVSTVIGFTCRKFPGTNMPYVKNSGLASGMGPIASEEAKLDSSNQNTSVVLL